MKNIKLYVIYFAVLLTGIILLIYPKTCSQGAYNGIILCVKTLVPSLLPFMVLSVFITDSGLHRKIFHLPSLIISKIFHIDKDIISVFILGIIGGYPAAAKIICIQVNKGKMTKEPIKVTYYYRKKIFNLGVEKKVKAVTRNDERREINKDITKQEVYSRQVASTSIKVEYSIVVENKGEIAGKAKLEENIPEGMEMIQDENKEWTISGNTAILTTEEINPGASKEYVVTLTWNNNKDNYGIKENIVKIVETSNKAGYPETETKDNEDGAQFAITVPTGIETYGKVTATALVILITAGIGIIAIKKKTK
jgi:hypothetical protein